MISQVHGARALGAYSPGIDSGGGVWSLGAKPGSICGMPLVPVVTRDMGTGREDAPLGVRCWGWTPPGQLDVAARHGRALIADVELRSTNKIRPDAGWTGAELDQAEELAALVGGVTSHGFVLRQLRGVLQRFATAGCVAYPQVYDSDRSTEPRGFLRRCVKMYRDAGFKTVVPLLGVVAGPEHLAAWVDECGKLGVRPDFWQSARLRQLGICPSESARWPELPRPELPRPELPRPRDPSPLPPISRGPYDLGSLALLLVVPALLYSLRRSSL